MCTIISKKNPNKKSIRVKWQVDLPLGIVDMTINEKPRSIYYML